MTDHITTLAVMQIQYSHIRQSDAEWEAIEAAKDALDQVAALQSENGSKDKLLLEVTAKYETAIKIQAQIVELQKRAEAALSRVEAERDEYKRALYLAIETHSVDPRQIERLERFYLEQARGAQGEA